MSYIFSNEQLEDQGTNYGMTTNGFTYVVYSKRRSGAANLWMAPCAIYGEISGDNVSVYYDSDASRCIRVEQSCQPGDQKHRYETCAVADATWHQIIVRSTDGNNIEAWVNGTKMTSYVDMGGSPPGNLEYTDLDKFNVGSWFDTLGTPFDGKVAEVGVWDRALTGTVSTGEIQNLIDDSNYQIRDITSDGSLLRYWPLYDSYADYSGNGKDLVSLSGTPTADSADHPVDPPDSLIQPAMNYYMNMMRG